MRVKEGVSRIATVFLPVSQDPPMIGGVVKPVAGNVQSDATRVGRQCDQQQNGGCDLFCAEHGGNVFTAA